MNAEKRKEETPTEYWERYLRRENGGQLLYIQKNYPTEKELTINVGKVNNNDIWDELLNVPLGQADHIKDAARRLMPKADHNYPDLQVRFINVSQKRKIKELRADDEVKLISIKALVKRVSDIRPKVTEAFFRCDAGHFTRVRSKNDTILVPASCSMDGCTFRTLEHIDARDVTIDRQWIYIQDPLEDLTEGGQPAFLKCEVVEDLCGMVVAGDRVVLNGIYRSIPKYEKGKLSAGKDVYFDVRGIELNEREFEEVKLTDSDIAEVTAISKTPDVYGLLASSIAPSILGMLLLKQAIVLMLFEGVTRTLSDGVTNRGHINVLCVSDPGMAKTRLLRFVASIAPRGVFTNATTSTKVGLVAPIVRDETTGEYTVQAGAYMIASGGVLCLDEVSELDKGDFKYLNEAMEDGEAHITKGGLNITVKTRASLLAACNPTEGDFDSGRPLAEQVKVPSSTLSRFDLKILLQDVAGEERDRKMIGHITNNYMDGTVTDGLLTPLQLRKYIAYGRQFNPKLTSESKKIIDDYYVKIRGETGNGDTMKVTPRQGTACIRLAEAHARVRLSETVSEEDAKAAIDLFDMCFRNVATDPVTGKVDPGRTERRPSRDAIVHILLKTVREQSKFGHQATEKSILEAMHQFDPDRVRSLIESFKKEGRLLEPKYGVYEVM